MPRKQIGPYINRDLIKGTFNVHMPPIGLFLSIQKQKCPYCGEKILRYKEDGDPERPSKDHVFPKKYGHLLAGNCLIVHDRCGRKKRGGHPYGCELIWLDYVNTVSGWDGITYRHANIGKKFVKHIKDIVENYPTRCSPWTHKMAEYFDTDLDNIFDRRLDEDHPPFLEEDQPLWLNPQSE